MGSGLRAVVRRLLCERGYSLIEQLIVLVILGTVLGALTGLFVSASTAQIDLNRRYQAQLNARLALEKLRREIHCASAITPAGQSSYVTLTLPAGCPTGSGTVTWCTYPIATQRYGLYRAVGAACLTTGPRHVDYLTATKIFSFVAPTTTSRAKLSINLPVNLYPGGSNPTYELVDDVVLRNSVHT